MKKQNLSPIHIAVIIMYTFVALTAASMQSAAAVPTNNPIIFTSYLRDGVVDGLIYEDEDILAYNQATATWSLYFDGSDVGLGGSENWDVTAFHLLPDGSILFSFQHEATFPQYGIGVVDDSDILRFIPTSLGANTAGTFEWYFDGSDVGLTRDGEDITAITTQADGRLVISTRAQHNVGFIGSDKDLLRFQATSLGTYTAGTWSLLLDGEAIGLEDPDEDVWGMWLGPADDVFYLKTRGAFTIGNVSGQPEVFTCVAPDGPPPFSACQDNQIFWGGLPDSSLDGLSVSLMPDNPYGIIRVDTDPVYIDGQKELGKLFDEVTSWPNTAVVHNVDDTDVAVLFEFNQPQTLTGIEMAIAGASGPDATYSWVVEKADSWDDMVNQTGSATVIVPNYITNQEGVVTIPFADEQTARVFKITASRDNGDGIVHLLELEPLFWQRSLRVVEVRYFPYGEEDVVHHPDDLSAQLQTYISEGSSFQKYKNPNAPTYLDVEVAAVYDWIGTRPAPEQENDWYSTIEQILAQNNLCDLISEKEIDQIWVWADPRQGYDPNHIPEYTISSFYFEPGGAQYVTYATPAFCGGDRSFTVMGFDTSLSADYALHSFGHFLEGMLGNVQTVELFWHRYGGDDANGFPLAEQCGAVHYPPNSAAQYDYDNQSYVSNNHCEDWNPQGNGTPVSINCDRWGCSQEGFLLWWLQNMPNADNNLTYLGQTLPNWWDFAFDIDANIQMYLDQPDIFLNRAFLQPYPYGIKRVDTDPVEIAGQKDRLKLFDGITNWPNTAIVHGVEHEDVGVLVAFDTAVTVNGFQVTVAGASGGSAAYTWMVETADTWADMVNASGSHAVILQGYETDQEGTVQVLFFPQTTKVFKITASRDNGNGIVHLLELEPLLQ